ncbi:chymotrypsin inhibitor-like [Colletes latitarsis]|uniref:chymotrypsin inhibitor-like n=1 Tax=Colletes latitarsis TaxID=2605962 RepID=UPI004036C9A8
MLRKAFILLVVFTIVSTQQCGPNEEFNSCGLACPPTCGLPDTRMCTRQCVIGCQCKSGYKKKGNDCVLPEDC